MTFNAKIGAFLLAFLLGLMVVTGLGGAVVSAQTQTMMLVQPTAAKVCVAPANNLRFGSVDYQGGASVSQLQSFLNSEGYFDSSYLGSGRFGMLTMRALAKYQAANGLPATGYFGPLTRAFIQQKCGTVVVPPSQNISIWSVNPTSAPVGSSVSVTGFGFTSDNTVLIDGMLAQRTVPIASSIAIACTTNSTCHGGINQTLTSTLPDALSPNCPVGSMCPMYMRLLSPGVHTISIQNTNGTSNTINFTVTGGTTNNPSVSITGLDTPASLSLGQVGTWTVHVNTPTSNTNLQYSVVWGDEVTAMGANSMAPKMSTVQSSATFTHAYSRSGNYTPVFTVTDDSGRSVTASNTVVVTPLY